LASTSRGTGAGKPEEIKVWDVQTGQAVLSIKGPTQPITSLAFGPDSRFLAACTGGASLGGVKPGEVKLWDTRDGREVLALDGYTHVALTPDGKRLIAVCQGGPKKPLDLLTRQEVADPGIFFLAVHQPNASAMSPDKQRLAQVAEDTIRVFDLSISEEERAYRLALAQPDPGWHLRQAADAERTGHWFAVAFHLDHAMKIRPSDDSLYPRRARAHAELQHWPQAAADFARAVTNAPEQVHAWRRLALTQLAAGQTEAYQQTCAHMLHRFGRGDVAAGVALLLSGAASNDVGTAVHAALVFQAAQHRSLTARTCVLTPHAVADPARLVALSNQSDPTTWGAVLCRAGRHDEAVKVLRPRAEAAARLYLALAEHGRGRTEEAKQAWEQAVQWLAAPSGNDAAQTNAARLSWEDRLEIDQLRREVEALLRAAIR
jgi:tetratricopeptide (TPR) repeat protein